ncbi:MAG: hypothetical protein BZ136_07515 [Methanosphaera sp. rholeuAM74]|nr:MAG: hypothetical protein BZ136_07515 [Methanosphaera sp. rholeuAM74]
MVDTTYTVVVNSDNIEGKSADKARIQRCVDALKQAGYNAIASGVGPNWHVSDMRNHKNSYIVCIVGGLCAGTILDYASAYYQNYMKNNNNKGGQAYYAKHGKYKVPASQLEWLERAWDDNFSPRSFKGCKPSEYFKKAGFDEAFALDDSGFPQAVVSMVQNGGVATAGGGLGSGTNNVGALKPSKGFVGSARGTSPQYWNRENYSDYVEVPFHSIRITDEDPHVKTCIFETTMEIPLLEGRDAILVTGDDCNDFGGIVLKKEKNSENGIWEYTCQGFLERVLANEITYVADGSETVYEILTNVMDDAGIPKDNLLPIDEYDIAVTSETQELLKKDKDLTETSDAFRQQQQDTTSGGGSSSSSNSSSNESGSTSTTKTYTKTLNTTKKGDVINPMKKKPVGLFKQKTYGDFFRTLIYDYGVNVDFYGDINGIPHFDVMDLETWKRSGFILPETMGISGYTYGMDITNIITQTGIENISAINGSGEIYTSQELLGVNIEDFVGRMGVVLENPSAQGSTNTGGEASVKITEKYQDSTGKTYETSQVIVTKGKPSCSKCSHKNGGSQPVYQQYNKAWLNKCPGCKEENSLKSVEEGDGKTVCSKCNKEYCQYCGYSIDGGNYQLTELFLSQTSNQTVNETKNSTTSDSSDSTNTTTST